MWTVFFLIAVHPITIIYKDDTQDGRPVSSFRYENSKGVSKDNGKIGTLEKLVITKNALETIFD